MKVLACTICGRNVLVGNATKTVVCAICNSSLAAKIKRSKRKGNRSAGRAPIPIATTRSFLLYLGNATAVMRAKLRRNGLSLA